MRSFGRKWCSFVALFLVVILVFSYVPTQTVRAEEPEEPGDPVGLIIPTTLETEMPIRSEDAFKKFDMWRCGGSLTKRTLNAMVLDSVTKQPITDVGVYLYSDGITDFSRTSKTTYYSAAALKDVPLNPLPSEYTDLDISQLMHFGIGSVPSNYQHPGMALMNMDLYFDTPAYDDLYHSLRDDGFSKVVSKAIAFVVEYGTTILDYLLPFKISYLQALAANTLMPKKYKYQTPDPVTRQYLTADIHYKDYSLFYPQDTYYWIQAELKPKTSGQLRFYVTGDRINKEFTLRDFSGNEYPLLRQDLGNGSIRLISDTGLTMGTYLFVVGTGETKEEYSFNLEGLAFPTTSDGRPDYYAFWHMSETKRNLLIENGEDWYNQYYATDPGPDCERGYCYESNYWTIATGSSSLYGTLEVINPDSLSYHEFSLCEPSDEIWVNKVWYGDAPADDETVTMYVRNQDGYLQRGLTDSIAYQYYDGNLKLVGDPEKDSKGTLIYLSGERAETVTEGDGITVWGAPLGLHSDFMPHSSTGILQLEEASVPSGWTSVSAEGTHYREDEDGLTSVPARYLINYQDPVQFSFRKLDMNGQVIKPYPKFKLIDPMNNVSDMDALNLPITVDESGLYTATLHKGGEYTLMETSVDQRMYVQGAIWTVTVSDTGEISIIQQNEEAGEAKLGSDGIWKLTDLYTNLQTFYIHKDWCDMGGTVLEPPANVAGVIAHMELFLADDTEMQNPRQSGDVVLWKENDWNGVWYVHDFVSRYTSSRARITETDWVDTDGNIIPADPVWMKAGSGDTQTFSIFDEDRSEAYFTLTNTTYFLGILKQEGAELSTEYTFVREWDNQPIVWDDDLKCYPLDLSGEAVLPITYRTLLEYDKNGTYIGKWRLMFNNGRLSYAEAIDIAYDPNTQTKPEASLSETAEGNMRLVLNNPSEFYTVNLQKEWDPSFIRKDDHGNVQLNYRPNYVTFELTAVGIGSTLEDMKPLPEYAAFQTISATLEVNNDPRYVGNPTTGKVNLIKNVIYEVTEISGASRLPSRPFYRVVTDGVTKTEWTLATGTTVTGATCGVVTEEDAGGTAYAYNNSGTFKVNIHVPESDFVDKHPGGVEIQLQSKENGNWVNVKNGDYQVSLLTSTGRKLSNVSFTYGEDTFTDIQMDHLYRARIYIYSETGDELATEDAELVLPEENGSFHRTGEGTPYQLIYDDSRNDQFIQEITLNPTNRLQATVCWLDADNQDGIRPDAANVTMELLTEQTGVDADGNPTTEWVPVLRSDGTPVTAEIYQQQWQDTGTQGYGLGYAYFQTDTFESQTYRVRVKTDNRSDVYVRFPEKNSLYKESYGDSNTAPSVTLTAQKEYSVEKKWDVDIEGLDVPKELTVVLQKKSGDSWSNPVQALVLTADSEWKGTFKPVDRYNYTKTGSRYTWNGEAEYRVRECKTAALKGKLAELLDGLEESVIKELGLPSFITDFLKGILPDNKKTEQQIYDWICKQTEDIPFANQIKALLKDNIIEDKEYITLDVPTYVSLLTGKVVDEHKTKYRASYKTSGNKTTITNLAVEEVTIWKLWVMDEDDRPDSVILMLTSKFDSDFAETASSLGIPLVSDFTPVWNPIEGKRYSIDLLITEWKLPLAMCEVEESTDDLVWKTRYVVKKYGESGIPQEFKGVEFSSYILSEAAKIFFGEFLGNFADVFDYLGFNILDKYFSVSIPALRMPDLVATIGQSLGFDNLSGLHSAVVNTWIHDDPSIGGRKIWKDENDADGIRPSSVTIHIYEKNGFFKGDEIGTAKASKSSYWTWTYTDEDLDDDATYIIEEEPVEGYTTEYDGYDIINTHKPKRREACNVIVQKKWDVEPDDLDSLTVYLKNGDAIVAQTVLTAPEWSYTFTGLDLKDKNGKKITYTVTEDAIPGYKLDSVTTDEKTDTEVIGDETVTTTTYTLTLNNAMVRDATALFTVNKVWQNDTPDQRPDEVQVCVASQDGTVNETLTLSESNLWRSYTEVPLCDADGRRMVYSVSEVSAIADYTTKVGPVTSYEIGDRTGYECTVTNTRGGKPDELKARFILTKTWKDVPADQIPESVTFTVTGSDGTEKTVTVSTSGWTAVLDDIPYADADGKAIEWSVDEQPIQGFVSEIGDITSETANGVVTYRCIVTNTVDPVPDYAKCDFIAEKIWEDGLTDAERPETLTLTLTGSNGTKRVAHVTAEDGWKHTFRGLDYTDQNNVRITYTLTEDVPENYNCKVGKVTRTEKDGKVTYYCTVTNTMQEGKLLFKVTKQWVNDSYLTRPAELIVYLLADGTVKDTQTLTESKGWTYTWEDLPLMNAQGKETVYTVTEKEVPGYRLTVGPVVRSQQKNNKVLSCTLTNTLQQADDPLNIRIVKRWSDSDADTRPTTLSMTLSAGSLSTGVVLDGTETDADGNWIKTLYDLPRTSESGTVLNWQLTETVPDGYACDIAKRTISDHEIEFTVTNTSVLSDMDLTVLKEWEDEDHEELRLDSITMDVLRDGEDTGISVTLNEANNWQQTVYAVSRYQADGTPYAYTLREHLSDDHYRFSQYSTPLGEKLTITGKNTLQYSGEEAVLHVTKVWEEWEDEEKDHDPLTIIIRQNGNPWLTEQLTPDEDGVWQADWNVPYRDENNNVITYSVTEAVPDGYTCEISDMETDTSSGITVYSCTITNTELPPEAYFTVTYVLNGDMLYGIPEGLTAPVDGKYYARGATVTIAPKQTTTWTTSNGTSSGVPGTWVFTGWTIDPKPVAKLSSKAMSSDSTFIINADTTLTGRWTFIARPVVTYEFVFYKEWQGGDDHDDPVFILYRSNGEVQRGADSQPKKTGDTEYTYWLSSEDDYYVVEEPMSGYVATYKNLSEHADADDRAYYGGTIRNAPIVPRTGDHTPLLTGLALLLLSGIGAVLLGGSKKKKHDP